MKKFKLISISFFLVAIAATFITSKVFAEKSSLAQAQVQTQASSQAQATNNLAEVFEDISFMMADTTCSSSLDSRDPYYEALQTIASKWVAGSNTPAPERSKIFDINGDGLVDIIKAYMVTSSTDTSESYDIFLNQAGAGYENTYSCSYGGGKYCGD